MYSRKECVSMILAGGQGSRLGILTKKIAKPALSFGGKYRIIDFTLSNCSNSGITSVGVLTQYQPLILNTYIGIGSPWDLDRRNDGVSLLPPYARDESREWYKGTANAIYQNMDFIDMFDPEYVLILSGDHIYKMDYSLMMEFHKENNADATIAVLKVSLEDAPRFGIMNTDENGQIIEFEEKPKVPKSDLASMGVYIFNWKLLKNNLVNDDCDPNSSHDFGKDIIPKMIKAGNRLFAFPFDRYWKDVGTIESLWEANMDLLSDQPSLDLYDNKWKIYSANLAYPPHYIGDKAVINQSLINEGCLIYGKVSHSVISTGVIIGESSEIKDSIIMPNVKIGKNVRIEKAIIGEDTIIGHDTIIKWQDIVGCSDSPIEFDNSGITVIGEKAYISKFECTKKVR
ncbi:glucose-1-phosphate adenylyltransferase [Desulfitibacter alkalitolerans]|uniref:glucose-1-phosphate adenylyltransferase n=1 Tax=Desulfitibacter alkalitolerans TaxID=264641 RepID=UPI000482E6C7|nr:glucose-1-phosphate adenylyltransferase [Desulfitibacter alkalitolerans]